MFRLPITALVTLGLVALSLTTTGRADDAPRKVALLVGVNKYLKPGFSDLDFAEADVVAVGAELKKLGFEVTILLGGGKGSEQATKANIEAAARRMVVPLGKHDVALVMLSGHGQQLQPDPDADPDVINFDKTQSYYCPVDARVNDPATQVSLSYLLDDILARDVGRKLLVVDACRDVPIDRTRGVRNARGIEGRVVALPEGTGVFFSCSAGQTSLERAELGHGLFTFCLLDGLRGGALQDGEIAWSDLFGYVNRRMSKPDIAQFMPTSMRQVPIQARALMVTRCWGSSNFPLRGIDWRGSKRARCGRSPTWV
ncbi:MAG: caspase family protein [Planctomycetaceae bacterium]